MIPASLVSPETRSVVCAVCGRRHSNTALCDACADMVATPCPWDGIEGCDCPACSTASSACGAFALAGITDLNVYTLPEVVLAREELAPAPRAESIDAIASTPVDGEELAWEGSYNPLPSIVESANALAWRRYGAAHVRLSTSDGATWSCAAIDAEGRAIDAAPVHVDTTPEDTVSGWITLAERHATPVADANPSDRPLTLAEAFPEGLSFHLTDESAPVIDRATGDVVEVIETEQRAEVA